MTRSDRSRLLRMAEKQGVLTARDVRRAGIHSQQLTRMVEEGTLERSARGQYRLSERPVTEGIERHRVEGVTIQVYGVEKTLADLFTYRGELGVEVAVEALREAWRDRRFVMTDLTRAARACRVERVMEPYLEAVIA